MPLEKLYVPKHCKDKSGLRAVGLNAFQPVIRQRVADSASPPVGVNCQTIEVGRVAATSQSRTADEFSCHFRDEIFSELNVSSLWPLGENVQLGDFAEVTRGGFSNDEVRGHGNLFHETNETAADYNLVK